MGKFQLWAQPWWVNLLVLVPVIAYVVWRRNGPALVWRRLALLAAFALAFGFVEAAVVVYLRAALGLLPGYMGTIAQLRYSSIGYEQVRALGQFPRGLLSVETIREAATIVILLSVTLLSASTGKERWACFLWTFALWDIAYYMGLWAVVGWPASFLDLDILFLIPVPWVAQVWFPLFVSTLAMAAVALVKRGETQ